MRAQGYGTVFVLDATYHPCLKWVSGNWQAVSCDNLRQHGVAFYPCSHGGCRGCRCFVVFIRDYTPEPYYEYAFVLYVVLRAICSKLSILYLEVLTQNNRARFG
jgi:hypothetical protein